MNFDFMNTCPLFKDIAQSDIPAMMGCLSVERRTFEAGNYIFRAGDRAEYVGVVITGRVHIIQENFWGDRRILAYMDRGDLFGEAYSCADTDALPVSVVAVSRTEVMLMDYRKIMTVCSNTCVFHMQLIKNMLYAVAERNIRLMQKMEHISKRSIREKVLSYLSAKAMEGNNNSIEIPFDRQELADFLCVERSALSRELGRMRKEGLISYHKNRFELKASAGR